MKVDNSNRISPSRVIHWIIMNAAYMALLVAATFYNLVWAENVLLFFLWTTGILIIMLLFSRDVYHGVVYKFKEKSIKNGNTVSSEIDTIYNLIFIGILVAYSWYWTAGLVTLRMLVLNGIREKAKE